MKYYIFQDKIYIFNFLPRRCMFYAQVVQKAGISRHDYASNGIVFAYLIKPGVGIRLGDASEAYSTEGVSVIQSIVEWVPDNVFASFSNFNIIQVIVFALFLGVGISMIGEKPKAVLNNFFDAGEKVMSKTIEIVMKTAPIGVFALMANMTGDLGLDALGALAKMLLTQYVSYLVIMLVVFPLFLKIGKVSVLQHYKNIYPVMVMGFATCSSAASLPLAMKVTKERCGVPAETVNLIAPPAATISQQACCAEMPIYAIFAAQLYGREYSLGEIALLVLLGIITAAGVAGIPGGGIMMCAIMLQTMGLPLTIVPWVAGIYRLIDMPNTMLNIVGDTVGMVMISSQMGDLDRDVFYDKPGARASAA